MAVRAPKCEKTDCVKFESLDFLELVVKVSEAPIKSEWHQVSCLFLWLSSLVWEKMNMDPWWDRGERACPELSASATPLPSLLHRVEERDVSPSCSLQHVCVRESVCNGIRTEQLSRYTHAAPRPAFLPPSLLPSPSFPPGVWLKRSSRPSYKKTGPRRHARKRHANVHHRKRKKHHRSVGIFLESESRLTHVNNTHATKQWW